MDLGSDGNSGYHGLERKYLLNVDLFNDQNHGCNCDWSTMLSVMKANSLMVLNCVRYNLPHGPRKGEDLRLHRMRDCLEKAYNKAPSSLPLFGPHQSAIMKSIEALGEQLPGIEDVETEMFVWLKLNAKLRTGGRRVHLSRFCAGHMRWSWATKRGASTSSR